MNRSTPNTLHTQDCQHARYTPDARPPLSLFAQVRPVFLATVRSLADALCAWQRKANGFHPFGSPIAKVGRNVILTVVPAIRRRATFNLVAIACTLPLAACATNERETYIGARRTVISSAAGDASQRVSRVDQRATVARADDSQP